MSIAAMMLEEEGLEGLLDEPVEGFDPNGPVLKTFSIRPLLTFPETAKWPMQPILIHHRGPYVVLGHRGRGLHGRVTKNYNLKRKEYVAHKYDAPLPLGMQLRQKRGETEEDVLDADAGKTTPLENVLPRHELIDADGNRFIEMPWIETFLSDIYEPDGVRKHLGNGIGKRELYSHIGQIINGLAGMHGVWRIAHRDLKLSNIGITPDKKIPGGKVWLSDFGLSSSGHTISPRDNLGWIYLRPPENFISKHPADERYDMWSLGALIYRMCTGKYPLETELDTLAKKDRVNDMDESKSIDDFVRGLSSPYANRLDPYTNGDDLLRKKIHQRNRFGMHVIPTEVRGLLDVLLRWDYRARCPDAMAAQGRWEELGRSRQHWRRGSYIAAGLCALSVAGGGVAMKWPAAVITTQQLERLNMLEKNADVFKVAPPGMLTEGGRELFRLMLKKSYDVAARKGTDDPPIDEAFNECQRNEYARIYARMDAETERDIRRGHMIFPGWPSRYVRMRNYTVNSAMSLGVGYLHKKDYFSNTKSYMAVALLGGRDYESLVQKYGLEKLSEIIAQRPEVVLSRRDAKFLEVWYDAFGRASPSAPYHPGYAPDPRYR